MKPWLDDLSEEWVVQPALPEADAQANSGNATARDASQSAPPKPTSRLPRMRQSSGSFSEIQVRQVAKDLKPPKRRSALAERSLSDNNITSTTSFDAPEPRHTSSSFGAPSPMGSVIHNGTVEQRPVRSSLGKDRSMHDTPEWRRRLLKGDAGYGDRKDLFSPMGLENIFQRPNNESEEKPKQRKSKLGLLKGLSAMPSSPPPWPNPEREESEQRPQGVEVSGLDAQGDESENECSCIRYRDDTQHSSHPQDAGSSTNTSQLHPQSGAPRTVSGQIEFENESFSPVYLTTNMKVGASAAAIPNFTGSELAHRLRHIGSPPTVDVHPASEGSLISQTREDSSFAKIQDVSLPEDLPAGTPDLPNVGRFVELRRGGYSRDGSFRRRPLSPSPRSKSLLSNDPPEQTVSPESSLADARGEASSPPLSPVTPHRQRQPNHLSPERAQTSGSPLKLFDAHDTFTSNRLQRRLSQLEYRTEKTISTTEQHEVAKTAQKTSLLTSVEEASFQQVSTTTAEAAGTAAAQMEARQLETFGQGSLNEYPFPEDFSAISSGSSLTDESAPDGSPSIDIAPPGSRRPIRFHSDYGSPQSRRPSNSKRQGLTRVSNPFRTSNKMETSRARTTSASMMPQEPTLEIDYAEGKRGPTSPFKNPTPKRRRTVHSIDDDEGDVSEQTGMKSVKDYHVAMQSVIGKKRKDARPDPSTNVADPDVLARRHILRPRNPTPSQRRREEVHAEIMEATEAFLQSSPKLNTIREQLDSSPSGPHAPDEASRAAAVANEIAVFSMERTQNMRDESRKRSVTTQDFLDEALKIMDFIRTKGRPTSGLGSLEESESEFQIMQDQNVLPSTPLTFSRPPSREGRMSAWREPNKHELDPNVMSHLRRYQDKESDEFMGSSFRSLQFPQTRLPVGHEDNSIIVEQNNIRITDNLDRHNKDSNTIDSGTNSQPITAGTHPSATSSMGQTVATSASRRSDHVTTIAAERVAHLIPEQIAGMSFDREKNIWIRQKSPSKEHRPSEDMSSANESEEDPFGNIPDLTVDETVELLLNNGSPTRPQATSETILEGTEDFDETEEVRPTTREGRAIPAADTSSAPSKISNFAWSFPKTETRATSWSDQGTQRGGTQKVHQLPTTYSIPESDETGIEHEIQYFEGRGTVEPTKQTAKIRDITFSIEERDFEAEHSREVHLKSHQQSHDSNTQQYSSPLKAARRGARTLPHFRRTHKPHEGDLSVLEELPSRNYRMQLSMSVSAPVLGTEKADALVAAPSSPVKGDVTFMLSDLPDFTLHQVDECELPDRVVVKHDGVRFSRALEDRYAQGTADLVKALQDVVPDEPYWEDLREVDLHDRGLTNLHRLEEFCFRLETLDVSDNDIAQVKGIPFTIRRLRAQNNCLNGLTSWATLLNLQHLDISRNDIESLDGLNELVHLRTLKIDNNQIKSLVGVLHLDGLMELSADGNQIQTVDFSNTDMKSLTSLHLRDNRISEVRGLHHLPQLRHLDLDGNCLEAFPWLDMPSKHCNLLQTLRLCGNGLVALSVADYCPRLEALYVDGNSLKNIHGLEELRHLRTFSAREQANNSGSGTDMGHLLQNTDVKSLYLSANPSRGLQISQHLLNLQRLELASMGLKELPDNFGQLTPNIRFINLNFNAIKDIRPLLNIKRLGELLVAGNKIARLRTNLAVLGKLTTLTKVDLRENPLTLRFYPPSSETRIMSLRHKPASEDKLARFLLPDGDTDVDKQYLERLDFETRLRRRVQEILLCTNCKNLLELDGLAFDRARILVKDDVWQRLLRLGVVKKSETGDVDYA